MCTDRKSRRAGPAGFTLIEAVMFIVIVGAGLAGVLTVLNLTAERSADPMLMKQSTALGEAFIDEILSRAYSNPSGYVGASTDPRSNFADVDDYNGYVATTTPGIYTRSGASIPGLTAYKVTISVQASASAIGPVGNQVPAGQMKLITVTVTDPRGSTYPFTAHKANY